MTSKSDDFVGTYGNWPHPSLGMFPSIACKEAAQKAMLVIERLSTNALSPSISDDILIISHRYEHDIATEKELSLSEIREQCSNLIGCISNLQLALATLNYESRCFVYQDPITTRFSPEDMAVLDRMLQKLRASASKSIPRQIKTPKIALKNAFASVVALRAQIEGRKFASSWAERAEVRGAPVAFKANDANFVLEVLNAIDSNVKFSHVRSIGKNWSKHKSRNK